MQNKHPNAQQSKRDMIKRNIANKMRSEEKELDRAKSHQRRMHTSEIYDMQALVPVSSNPASLSLPLSTYTAIGPRRRRKGVNPFGPYRVASVLDDIPPAPPCLTITNSSMTNGPSSISVDTGAYRIMKIKTGVPWVDTVLNGIPGEKDSRFPDPFSMCKSSLITAGLTYTLSSMATSSSSSTSSFDYSQGGLIRGDGYETLEVLPSLAAHSYAMDWAHNDMGRYSTFIDPNFFSRPNGAVIDIVPQLRGVSHSVKIFAFPTLPIDSIWQVTTPTGWPTDPKAGLNALLVSWGGREWEVDPNSKGVRLCCLPTDSRGLSFLNAGLERSSLTDTNVSAQAWGGWVFWVTGMSSIDSINVTVTTTFEVMPVPASSSVFLLPNSSRYANGAARDVSVSTLQGAADAGLTGFQLIDKVIDFVGRIIGAGKKVWDVIKPLIGSSSSTLYNPAFVQIRVETKDDSDVHPVLPKRQLNEEDLQRWSSVDSAATSSSSKAEPTPRAGRRPTLSPLMT